MFQQGEIYRQFYLEMVSDSPFGKWGIGSKEEEKFLLQHIPLLESPPQTLINQYLSLDHPLLIPYLEVYQEPGALVFVRPYLLIENLIHQIPLDEETADLCCKQLADLEAYLKDQPIPMKPVYHPENIGLTDDGYLKVFLCGSGHIQLDFSDLETFRQLLTGQDQKEEQVKKQSEPESPLPVSSPPPFREAKPQVMVRRRTAVISIVVAGVFCFSAGAWIMNALQNEKNAPVQAESTRQVIDREPEQTPEAAPEPAPEELTQEDIDQSRIAAEKFVSSLDRDDHQKVLKKRARSMTVLPNMKAEQIDSRPGKIEWEIEAEVYHSNGNMEGNMYRTMFRVVTVKENGVWQVEDIQVLDEKKE